MASHNGKRLRVAISGYGWIAKNRHVPCFRRSGAEIVGVYRSNYPDVPPGAVVVDEFEQLLELEPDIVAVCSPPWAHADQVIMALEHRCHVLVEKPMAMNSEQAQRMSDAAARMGRLLCVAHSHLYDRAMMKAARLVDSGEIGELTSVHALFFRGNLPDGKPWLFELPGGLAFDELPHPVYLLEKFLGPLHIRSLDVQPVPGRNTPRQVHAVLQGPRGAGQISMIMDSPVSEWHLVLTGTREMLIVDLFRDVLVRVPSDGAHAPASVLKTTWGVLSSHLKGVVASGVRYATGNLYYGHDVLIERFVASVLDGGAPPVSLDSAVRTQALVDAITQPAREFEAATIG